jgi:hypothetical protein
MSSTRVPGENVANPQRREVMNSADLLGEEVNIKDKIQKEVS